MKLAIATAPRRDSRRWTNGEITWQELTSWLDTPDDRKEAGNYLLGNLRDGLRRKGSVIARSCLALDADSARPELPDLVEMLVPGMAAVHTTYSSTPDQPKFRILIPVDRPLLPDEYRYAVNRMMDLLGRDQFDQTCAEPERYMFRPATGDREHYDRWVFDGQPAAADALLQGFETDLSSRQAPRHTAQNKRDPLEVEGAVGAFNRCYTIDEAIAKFELPYDPMGEGRWSLHGTASVAGLNLISDHLVFSHHATDPAYGRACSAFDLVRLHLFGDLDEDSPAGTPVNRLPSHSAMLKFASEDKEVMADLARREFGVADQPDDDDRPDDQPDDDQPPADSWKLHLLLNGKTGKMRDEIDNWDLITRNDPEFTCLRFNEMSQAIVKGAEELTTADRYAIYHHVERAYHVRASRAFLDELIETSAARRPFHPVRDYLNGLEWDGTERMATALPGVADTPYTRMVARKSFVSAVARIFDPGCKWDHTLVLYGKENLGKSYWIDRVARGYSSTLGRIDQKDTLLAMQRSWIMVSDEGYSLKKADVDVQKEFLTRTHDVFRLPYAKDPQRVPRHCVIWGTTNDEVFLRRQEGNRRFLIVRCEFKVDFARVTPDYIDQLWAEAVMAYQLGEPLYLSEDDTKLATLEREAFTEEDAMAGVIERYLDTLVPEDWDAMPPDERRAFLQTSEDGLDKGTKQLTQVCSAQIWVEALGQDFGKHKRADLLQINTILKRLPNWQSSGAARPRIPFYGPQQVFSRRATPEVGDADLIALS